jgi:hypothetical protein
LVGEEVLKAPEEKSAELDPFTALGFAGQIVIQEVDKEALSEIFSVRR